MNCKPNQMAMVVRIEPNLTPVELLINQRIMNHVVTTTELVDATPGQEVWGIEKPIPLTISFTCTHGHLHVLDVSVSALSDYILRPFDEDPDFEGMSLLAKTPLSHELKEELV